MPTFIDRLLAEANELEPKIIKLSEFFYSEKIEGLTDFEKLLLDQQLIFMQNYMKILRIRIALYHKNKE